MSIKANNSRQWPKMGPNVTCSALARNVRFAVAIIATFQAPHHPFNNLTLFGKSILCYFIAWSGADLLQAGHPLQWPPWIHSSHSVRSLIVDFTKFTSTAHRDPERPKMMENGRTIAVFCTGKTFSARCASHVAPRAPRGKC